MPFLILAVLWLFVAPFLILGKMTAVEERLNQRIGELMTRLKTLEPVSGPASAPAAPPAWTPVPIPDSDPISAPTSTWAPLSTPASDFVSPVSTFSVKEHKEHVEEYVEKTAEPETIGTTPDSDQAASNLDDPRRHEEGLYGEAPNMETPDTDAFDTDASDMYASNMKKARAEGSDFVSPVLLRLRSWLLTEGNIWVCAGVLLFFVGFGLLFSYAVQAGLLTLEMRLAGAALTGIVMAAFGFRMRERRRAYALILQGGGMGVLYLVVLAATRFNALSTALPVLSPSAGVVAMLALSVFTVLLALLQDYQPLALFAVLGGFVAPVLVSTGSRDHVTLFSIFTLLNLEILMIVFRRNWRILYRMGFALTVGIGTAWGLRDWRPELFATVEPFLVAFLATYTLISIRTARRECENPSETEDDMPRADLPLAVCVPFSFFLLQMPVAGQFVYGMALSCLGLGLWFLTVGAWLLRAGGRYHRPMARLFVGLCLLFSNLAVPYTFENAASSAIWAVEGAFLLIVACRYGSYKTLLGGVALHVGALVLYNPALFRFLVPSAGSPNPVFVSGVLFTASHWVSGFWATRFHPRGEGPLYDDGERWLAGLLGRDGAWVRLVFPWFFTVMGSFWWWRTLYGQLPHMNALPWFSVFAVACLTALAGAWASERLDWRAARFPLMGPLFAGLLWTFSQIAVRGSVSFSMGNTAFPVLLDIERNLCLNALVYGITIGFSLHLLRRTAAHPLPKAVCFVAVLVGLALARAAMLRLTPRFAPGWETLFSALPLAGVLLYLARARGREPTFRIWKFPLAAATGLMLMMSLPGLVASLAWKGAAAWGVFIPVLNPLELWQGSVVVSICLWVRVFFAEHPRFRIPRAALPVLFFIWISQAATRGTWWHLAVDAGDIWTVLRTSHCQGVLSILWGVLGLGGILRGQKARNRTLWCMGSGLLAVDMAKLLLFDLNRAATLTRILAFLVTGGLFLLIGWIAPLPPAKKEKEGEGN